MQKQGTLEAELDHCVWTDLGANTKSMQEQKNDWARNSQQHMIATHGWRLYVWLWPFSLHWSSSNDDSVAERLEARDELPSHAHLQKVCLHVRDPLALFFQPVILLLAARSISLGLLGARFAPTACFVCLNRILHCLCRCLRRVEWVQQEVGSDS